MARGMMNRAQAAVALEERACAVTVARGDPVRRERTASQPQRLHTFAFLRLERNRPARPAARAGMPASIRRVKTQTLGHDSGPDHRNPDYRTVARRTGVSRSDAKMPRGSAARELPLRKNRHVGTGYFRATAAARA